MEKTKSPHVFTTRKDFVKKLKKHKRELRGWLEKEWNLEDLITRSVKGNTFRAFQNMPEKPSVVYRTWAKEQLSNKTTVKTIKKITSQKEYDAWIKKFSDDFGDFWKKRMKESIQYGPKRKLPNLLMKHFVRWEELTKKQRQRLIDLIHVPLDQYTLLAVKNCIDKSKLFIPKNATMSFTANEEMYNSIQKLMRDIQERPIPRRFILIF